MRIQLSLDPALLKAPVAGPSNLPIAQIGGELVLIELQGELSGEGDKSDGVVGVLALDRSVRYNSLQETSVLADKISLHLRIDLHFILASITCYMERSPLYRGPTRSSVELSLMGPPKPVWRKG